jgi:diguanylate cyclase (GGDEF)-like protein
MLPTPDILTLRLCSVLASAAYATIFVVLWKRRRSETYLLHWGASSALYALALLGFDFMPGGVMPLSSAIDYGLIALSDFLVVSGMRRFDGKPGFAAWMIGPVAATVIGVTVPLLALPGAAGLKASNVVGSALLGGCMVICACVILFGNRGEASVARRIVGIGLLAYGPGYVISICIEIWGAFSSTTLDLLPMLQDQVLVGVLNLGLLATPWERALRELKESVLRDGLTRAWNRTWLKQHEAELATPSTSLFLIDIDHFKAINDTFGHAAGDAVLITFSNRIEKIAAHHGGMFVRLGGDEFVMLARTTGDEDAHRLAEEVRAIPDPALSGLPPYSISIGLARVQAGEGGLSPALARADLSLYRAKASGRDQVAA